MIKKEEEEIIVSFLKDYERLRVKIEMEEKYNETFKPVFLQKGYIKRKTSYGMGCIIGACAGLVSSIYFIKYLPFPNLLTIPLFIMGSVGIGGGIGGLLSLYISNKDYKMENQ